MQLIASKPKRSFADVLDAADGRPTGFDYLRIGLAAAIFLIHCFEVPYPLDVAKGWLFGEWHALFAMPVPMFFALSGFLVAGSLQRCATLVSFLGLRALRIFPALAAEVLISALILGPLVTTLPLRDYFAHHEFHAYFLNILGDIHFFLPGVFESNPQISMVNSQLWTVPQELECYIALALLSMAGIVGRRYILLIASIAAQFLIGGYFIIKSRGADLTTILDASTVHNHVPLLCFLFGVTAFFYKERIPHSFPLAVLSAAVCYVLFKTIGLARFVAIPTAYLTIYIGLLSPRKWNFLQTGDYSYGIYLFSMPILQTIVSLGPWTYHWWVVILIGAPVTFLFAVGSWHLLEKHALKMRRNLFGFEKEFRSKRMQVAPTLSHFIETGLGRPKHDLGNL